MQIFSAGRDGTNEPTEGSTRGPRGPKNCQHLFRVGLREAGIIAAKHEDDHLGSAQVLLGDQVWQNLKQHARVVAREASVQDVDLMLVLTCC